MQAWINDEDVQFCMNSRIFINLAPQIPLTAQILLHETTERMSWLNPWPSALPQVTLPTNVHSSTLALSLSPALYQSIFLHTHLHIHLAFPSLNLQTYIHLLWLSLPLSINLSFSTHICTFIWALGLKVPFPPLDHTIHILLNLTRCHSGM